MSNVTCDYIAVEMRLSLAEAEALEIFTRRVQDLVRTRVINAPEEIRQLVLSATQKLHDRLKERQPVWSER